MSSLLPRFSTSTAKPRIRLWARRAARQRSGTARQDHSALGRAANSSRGQERQINLRGGGRSCRRGHGSRGFHYAPVGGDLLRPARACRRDGGNRRDFASAAGADMAFRARGRRRCRGISGDLRCPASCRCGAHIRERGGRRFLRRGLARYSANVFLQPFCAALLAGMVGALAVRYQLSSSLRLVAVCPCMVLVPGPHFLNGAID